MNKIVLLASILFILIVGVSCVSAAHGGMSVIADDRTFDDYPGFPFDKFKNPTHVYNGTEIGSASEPIIIGEYDSSGMKIIVQ